ncbi:MAG: WbqC family protein, partial [Nitrososphaerota archaeon]|nr:WbqC family protein [Nitrososphaerota archaeon]
MKVAIHQPHYFAYPGFFHKLTLSDMFVIMDEAQYDKRFTNRNLILDPHGPVWLTIPIDKTDKFAANKDVRVNDSLPWRKEHWKKITVSYANAKFFNRYAAELKEFYDKSWPLLFEFDLRTTRKTMEWLGIKIPIVKESELNIKTSGTQRLADICRAVGADTYVSGRGGKNYMDEGLFEKCGLKVEHQNYSAPQYLQRFSESYVPDLS